MAWSGGDIAMGVGVSVEEWVSRVSGVGVIQGHRVGRPHWFRPAGPWPGRGVHSPFNFLVFFFCFSYFLLFCFILLLVSLVY